MLVLGVLVLGLTNCCANPPAELLQPRYYSEGGLAWKYGYTHRISPEVLSRCPDALEELAIKRIQYHSPFDSIGGFVMGTGFGHEALAQLSRRNSDAGGVEDFQSALDALKAGIAQGRWASYRDLWAPHDKDYARIYAFARLSLDRGILDAPDNQWEDAPVAEMFLLHVTPAKGSSLAGESLHERALVAIPSDLDSESFLVLSEECSSILLQVLGRLYPQ